MSTHVHFCAGIVLWACAHMCTCDRPEGKLRCHVSGTTYLLLETVSQWPSLYQVES